jgi:AraC-like DNA-binding protein
MPKCWIKVRKLYRIYSKVQRKSPLQIIQDRTILEARRLLRYSDKSIKEIAYEIGYEDIQPSAGFLKAAGISPSDFKKEIYLYYLS